MSKNIEKRIADLMDYFDKEMTKLSKELETEHSLLTNPITPKVGTWFGYNGGFISFNDNSNFSLGYGFDKDGVWCNEIMYSNTIELTKVDIDEVIGMLKLEAIERGLTEGNAHDNFDKESFSHPINGEINYDYRGIDALYYEEGTGLVYKEGKWADSFQTWKGYSVDVYGDSLNMVKVGCKSIGIGEITVFTKALTSGLINEIIVDGNIKVGRKDAEELAKILYDIIDVKANKVIRKS